MQYVEDPAAVYSSVFVVTVGANPPKDKADD